MYLVERAVSAGEANDVAGLQKLSVAIEEGGVHLGRVVRYEHVIHLRDVQPKKISNQ